MTVGFFDTADRLALGNARRCASLEELLGWADVVTLHVDGRPDNRGLFGEAEFAGHAPGVAVPQPEPRVRRRPRLAAAHIESGHIAGAAVDVFYEEPAGDDEPSCRACRASPT